MKLEFNPSWALHTYLFSPLTAKYLLLATYHIMLTTCYSPPTTCYSPLTYHLPLTPYKLTFNTYNQCIIYPPAPRQKGRQYAKAWAHLLLLVYSSWDRRGNEVQKPNMHLSNVIGICCCIMPIWFFIWCAQRIPRAPKLFPRGTQKGCQETQNALTNLTTHDKWDLTQRSGI